MNKSSLKLLAALFFIIIFSISLIIYYTLNYDNKFNLIVKKQKVVKLIKLPDLAFVTETIWLRHRSINNVYSIFPDDGTLLEYYPSSFVYNIQTVPVKKGEFKK